MWAIIVPIIIIYSAYEIYDQYNKIKDLRIKHSQDRTSRDQYQVEFDEIDINYRGIINNPISEEELCKEQRKEINGHIFIIMANIGIIYYLIF